MKRVLFTILILLVGCEIVSGRTIRFAGRQWLVREWFGGPGPNKFSDSAESVWVDKDGSLHLKLRKIGDEWYCAEVRSVQPTSYGMHRFYLASRVDKLDKNVCASPFLYKSDSEELDIEFRWDHKGNNSQFVVQPFQKPGHMERFKLALTGDYSTHSFNWQKGFVDFLSLHGHYKKPPEPKYLIRKWKYEGDDIVRQEAGLKIMINLYLVPGKKAPASGKEVELIVKRADLPPLPGQQGPKQ